jgi:excisionase family DNA binding protein
MRPRANGTITRGQVTGQTTLALTPRLLTIQEAATYLATTVPFIRTLIYRRELPYVKAGKRFVIDMVDLDKWVEKTKQLA